MLPFSRGGGREEVRGKARENHKQEKYLGDTAHMVDVGRKPHEDYS